MLNKFIDFRIFFISLAIGLFLVYLHQPTPTIVFVYPTPENVNNLELKDKANNCFRFKSVEVTCPSDKSQIHDIPVQSKVNQAPSSSLFGESL